MERRRVVPALQQVPDMPVIAGRDVVIDLYLAALVAGDRLTRFKNNAVGPG
jgi:hypothetical protein